MTQKLLLIVAATVALSGCGDDKNNNNAFAPGVVAPNYYQTGFGNTYGIGWAGSLSIVNQGAYEDMLEHLGVCNPPGFYITFGSSPLDCDSYRAVAIDLRVQQQTLPTNGYVAIYSSFGSSFGQAYPGTQYLRPTLQQGFFNPTIARQANGSDGNGFQLRVNALLGRPNILTYTIGGDITSNTLYVEVNYLGTTVARANISRY